MLWTLVVIVISLVIGTIWIIGAREPVYSVKDGEPAWFVAVRANATPRFTPGVRITWSGAADFPLIGAEESYWTRFYVLAGGRVGQSPLLSDDMEDAFVARIALFAPPSFALGMLRCLCNLGIIAKPKGEVMRNVDGVHFRKDVIPNNESIAALLSRPTAYAPTMVNFLAYLPQARRSNAPSTALTSYRCCVASRARRVTTCCSGALARIAWFAPAIGSCRSRKRRTASGSSICVRIPTSRTIFPRRSRNAWPSCARS